MAQRAVDYGAFRYLTKPVTNARPRGTRFARRRAPQDGDAQAGGARPPGEGTAVDSASGPRSRSGSRWGVSLLWMAFQPIVAWRERRVYGYEALLRSDEPLMKNPGDVLDAAERLGELPELGRAVRAKVADAAREAPPGVKLFVNLHCADLDDEELYRRDAPLTRIAVACRPRGHRARLARRRDTMRPRAISRLRALGFEIAIDDLGAGYAGLTEFAQLEPAGRQARHVARARVDSSSRSASIVRSMNALATSWACACRRGGRDGGGARDAGRCSAATCSRGICSGSHSEGFRRRRGEGDANAPRVASPGNAYTARSSVTTRTVGGPPVEMDAGGGLASDGWRDLRETCSALEPLRKGPHELPRALHDHSLRARLGEREIAAPPRRQRSEVSAHASRRGSQGWSRRARPRCGAGAESGPPLGRSRRRARFRATTGTTGSALMSTRRRMSQRSASASRSSFGRSRGSHLWPHVPSSRTTLASSRPAPVNA